MILFAKNVGVAIHSHWEVENKVQWVLDVTFKENDSRIQCANGSENVAVIRLFVLNLTIFFPRKIAREIS